MNREDAIKAMKQGKKVTHRFMSWNEYIYMIGDVLYDEEDCILNFEEFWKHRNVENWNKDWSIR